jgi:hypothetical protein
MKTPPRSVGLLLPGPVPSRQAARILGDIEALGLSAVRFVLGDPGRGPGVLYSAYRVVDRLLFGVPADPAAPAAPWTRAPRPGMARPWSCLPGRTGPGSWPGRPGSGPWMS